MVRPYEDPARDFTDHVAYETTKTLVHLRQDRRSGFWSITCDIPGPMPAKYSGKYTTLSLAMDAASAYIRDKKFKIIQGPIPYTKELDE